MQNVTVELGHPSPNQYFGDWILNRTLPGALPTIKVSRGSVDRDGTIDTGLGSGTFTGSQQDDQASLTDHKIVGVAHNYSDASVSECLSEDDESSQGRSVKEDLNHPDLDSDAAQQIETQYKQIMRKKRDKGYTSVLPTSCQPTDYTTNNLPLTAWNTNKKIGGSVTDQESIKTEDIESEYRKVLIQQESDSSKSRVNAKPATPARNSRKGMDIRHSAPSDMESVKTEDFENQFHSLMVKRVAPPVSDGYGAVDSDLDTVRSQLVQEKFQNALNKESETSEMSSTSGDEGLMDTVIEKPAAVPPSSSAHTVAEIEAVVNYVLQQQQQQQQQYGHLIQHPPPKAPKSASPNNSFSRSPKHHRASNKHQNRKHHSHRRSPAPVTPVTADEETTDGQAADTEDEIQRQTNKIRKEIEKERKQKVKSRQSASPMRPIIKPDVQKPTKSRIAKANGYHEMSPTMAAIAAANQSYHQALYTPSLSSCASLSTPNLANNALYEPRESPNQPPQYHQQMPPLNQELYYRQVAAALNNAPQITPKVQTDTLLSLQRDLHLLTNNINKAKNEKQLLADELNKVQEMVKQNRNDIRTTERTLKQNRARAEDVRTDLMLAEFKRDSARKELHQLDEEIQERKQRVEQLVNGEIQNEQYQRATVQFKQQVANLTSENSQLKEHVRHLEAINREKRELELQLNSSKENLFSEQRQFRDQIDALEEDVETKLTMLEEARAERDTVQKKLNKLEQKFKQHEKDTGTLIKEKTQEYEELRDRLNEQLSQSRQVSSQEATELRGQLQDLSLKHSAAHSELTDKNEQINKLREEVSELKEKLQSESDSKQQITEVHRQSLTAAKEDKNNDSFYSRQSITFQDALVAQLKTDYEAERKSAMEEQRQQFEDQHDREMTQLEDKLRSELNDTLSQLKSREIELTIMRDKLSTQEGATRQLSDIMRQETQDQVRLERDRCRADAERDLSQKLSSLKCDMEKQLNMLQGELATERDLTESQLKQINNFKMELEEARRQNRDLHREKFSVLSQAKENVEWEKQRQLEYMKEKLEKEANRSLEKLREAVKKQEAEIERLRNENDAFKNKERENISAVERQERIIIEEINKECQKTADTLGVTARRTNVPVISTAWASNNLLAVHGSTKAATTSAIANLRACNEELRRHVQELKQELEYTKQAAARAENSKHEELEDLRRKLLNDKNQALDALRDRLIKENMEEISKLHRSVGRGKTLGKDLMEKNSELRFMQNNMSKWRDDTAEKLAKKFKEEMSRELEKRSKDHDRQKREWDRQKLSQQREIDRLERELNRTSTAAGHHHHQPIPVRSDSAHLLNNLRSKVKALQTENMSLKTPTKQRYTSTPDLTSNMSFSEEPLSPPRYGTDVTTMRLEQRVSEAERRAKLAEDRASNNKQMLNHKLLELSKVQETLTHQTKEMMQLERAYSQLQNQTSTPTHSITSYR